MHIRILMISVWNLLDPLYYAFSRLHYINSNCGKECIFRVRLTRYKGKEVTLTDGTVIQKNDLLIKIHLHNVRILKRIMNQNNQLRKGKAVFRMVVESMPMLAEYVKNHPDNADIKGIIGITLINKGFKPLGFECDSPVNKFYHVLKKIGQIPILLLSSKTLSLRQLRKQKLVYLMMSKEKLLDQYLVK